MVDHVSTGTAAGVPSIWRESALALRRDGIAVVRGLLAPTTVESLLEAVRGARASGGPYYRRLSPEGQPAMESDLFRWREVPEIGALVTEGILPALAAAVFGVDEVVLLEDQWFASSSGSSTPSPWHQDEPYHPLDTPFLTVWLPLTPVPGAVGLRGVRGSHLADVYAPVEFSAGEATLGAAGFSLDPVPDVDADPVGHPVHAPDVVPGDAVLLDSRTLHAAGGLCTAEFTRLSIRYAHPDTRFRRRPWAVAAFWDDHDWTDGAPLASPAFPRLAVAGAR